MNEQLEIKKELVVEISEYICKMDGKSIALLDEIKEMYGLYNRYYGTAENDYSCDLCAIRIYSKLKKIKASYDTTNRVR